MSGVIILDRDGVINEESPDFIKSPDEWHPIAGSLEAMGRLCQQGWRLAVATNQSGVARGLYDLDALDAIHAKMQVALAEHGGRIEVVAFCPHGPDDGCDCRKPAPGLLDQIAGEMGLESLAGIDFVGDSARDLEAARARDCRPVLVLTGNGATTLEQEQDDSLAVHT